MAAICAEVNRVGSLDAGFQQISLVQYFTILLWNINNLKSVEKSKTVVFSHLNSKNSLYYRN